MIYLPRNLGDFQGGRSVTWTVWWILLWLRLIQWSLMEFEIITHYYNVGPPFTIAFSWCITPITMVHDTQITIVNGVYKQSYKWGGHIVCILYNIVCCCQHVLCNRISPISIQIVDFQNFKIHVKDFRIWHGICAVKNVLPTMYHSVMALYQLKVLITPFITCIIPVITSYN